MDETTQATNGYLDVEGGRLYYEVAGKGHPLVLIHAGIADSSMWDDQFDLFARQYRVIRYDTRGFGKTETEDVAFSNRQDLYDLLKRLGADKTYVIGVSRGGQIAIDFTLELPEMVDALIPVDAGVSGFDFEAHPPTDEEMRLIQAMMEAEEKRDFERMADLDVQLWVDGPGHAAGRADQRVRERVRQMCLNNYTNHAVEGQPRQLEPPAAGRLSEIHAPTLVIVGDLDTSDTQIMADQLAQDIPGAKKAVIHGTAHLPSMEKPEEFNKIVLDFLQALP